MPALRGRAAQARLVGGSTRARAQGARSRTVRRPGLDAAVLRLRPSLRGLAVSLQGPRPGEADAFAAGMQAVLGAARNVACAGGEPIGLTDCLNFGNPEKPEIGYELAQAIEGISQAADALGVPVVSGNVSLYNDTDGRSIPPTPVVGCVGIVNDVRLVPSGWERGDVVLLASAPEDSLAAEVALVRFLRKAAPLLTLCHDVGSGGLEARRAGAGARPTSSCRRRPRQARRSSPARRRTSRVSAPRASCRSARSADVRRLRRLRARARRCAAHVLRPVRPATPRPGVGRDRGLRAEAAHGAPRPGPRDAGVRRAEAARAARASRDRPHALLHHRLVAVGECATARAARPQPDGRARPQRQPR
ncbi:MAG: hypothetical protein E6F98_13645 [Actinobacteria bacterium]|nr:MAG: hypothetical protein E6F98_13645 [Actinomycetota bacterium]